MKLITNGPLTQAGYNFFVDVNNYCDHNVTGAHFKSMLTIILHTYSEEGVFVSILGRNNC